MAVADQDRDGFVGRTVFTSLMLAVGFERTSVDAFFEALTPPGSERVATRDWRASILEFYRPDRAGITSDRLDPRG